jgi:ribosomal-protein-alanine N-acetyltransferase
MTTNISYFINKASQAEIEAHLKICDNLYVPRLSDRVEIKSYAEKMVFHAKRFEAWSGTSLVGLIGVYLSNIPLGYITNVSVLPNWHRLGLASNLMKICVNDLDDLGFFFIDLEVNQKNDAALSIYKSLGYIFIAANAETIRLRLNLKEK